MSNTYILFEGLDDPARQFVEDHLIKEHLAPGDLLIREGEENADLYFIDEGEAALVKGDGDDKVTIGQVGAGAVLGELSFLDDSPRSLSVIAVSSLTVTRFPRAAVERPGDIEERVRHQVERNIALLSTARLRETSKDFAESLRREVDLLKEQVDFGTMFIVMVILFGLNGFLLRIIQTYFADYYYFNSPNYTFLYARMIDWGGFIAFAAPLLYLVKVIKFPLREVVNLKTKLRQTLTESLILSAVIALAIVPASFGLVELPFVAHINDRFDFEWFLIVFTPDYFLHSYIQELVARGIMQNSIQKFLRDRKGHRSVIICSLAFAVMHVHLGIAFAMTTGIASLAFGYLYLRHGNLLGVTIVHWVVGALAMRYMTVLDLLK